MADRWMTYTRDRFGHALEDSDVEGGHLGGTHLLGVGVEPQVVSAVGTHVMLIAAQVEVPHVVSSRVINN